MSIQQVRAQLNGTWYTLTLNGGTGKYEATITAPTTTSFNQAGGYYQVTIEATDDHGNKVTDASVAGRLVVKEVTKPTIAITSPTNGALIGNNKPPITFTLRDEANGSGIKIASLALKIDGGTVITNTSPGMVCTAVTSGYDCTYTPQTVIADGAHTITVDVTDNDGNAGVPKTATITIDTTPPVLNITAPEEGLKTNMSICNVTGTTNDAIDSAVTVSIKLNGTDQGAITVDGSGNFAKAVTLALGDNTLVVRSTDDAGKYTEVTRAVSYNTTAPVISNLSITPNPASVGTTLTISVTVTDA